MNLTPPVIALISRRLRDPKLPKVNQAQIAEAVGKGRSWATKLMNGSIRQIDDEDAAKLEAFLGVRLLPYLEDQAEAVPEIAKEIGRRMKSSLALTKVIAALMELPEKEVIQSPKWIETQDMSKIGQEIIRIAFANEDKPGKVARLVLELLA